jgi:hypothetical protein
MHTQRASHKDAETLPLRQRFLRRHTEFFGTPNRQDANALSAELQAESSVIPCGGGHPPYRPWSKQPRRSRAHCGVLLFRAGTRLRPPGLVGMEKSQHFADGDITLFFVLCA